MGATEARPRPVTDPCAGRGNLEHLCTRAAGFLPSRKLSRSAWKMCESG